MINAVSVRQHHTGDVKSSDNQHSTAYFNECEQQQQAEKRTRHKQRAIAIAREERKCGMATASESS
jgi:hypothetical protein